MAMKMVITLLNTLINLNSNLKEIFSMNKPSLFFITAILAFVCLEPAFAGSAPWETGLTKLQDSLTGPVATGLALIGIVAAGGMLLFGGEISGFMKSVVYLILVISLIICADKVLTMVGTKSSTGAVIAAHEIIMQNSHTMTLPAVVRA